MPSMKKSQVVCLWLILILTLSFFSLAGTGSVLASPGKLTWSIVDTPSGVGKVVNGNSEINALAISSDSKSFYTIDIPNSQVYKSTDGGITWVDTLTNRFTAAGATLPAWDIAIAPDNPNIIAVVTDNRTRVYVSGDGGNSWSNTGAIPGLGVTLIADITISPPYTLALGKTYDIAIGTRLPDGLVNGDVWVMQLGISPWQAQGIGWDITAVRFSPNYVSDKTILVVASDNTGTYLCFGIRDVTNNTTVWNVPPGYPVRIPGVGASPTENQIITSDLTLPSDYLGTELAKRRVYISWDSAAVAGDDVYRLDDTAVYRLNVNAGAPLRLTSLAYSGTYEGGKLIAGGALADANLARAVVLYTTEPEKAFPTWVTPVKPPTGGGGSGYAWAQVAWSPDGTKAYAGTATAVINSASAWANMVLPGPWSGDNLDESAFSVTRDGGETWNQLSLIDTEISRLGDVAASADSKTLYLASINTNAGLNGFDSAWCSLSDPLGRVWERVWCGTTGDDILLRTNEKVKSDLIILVDRVGGRTYSSSDKGQQWQPVVFGITVTDLTVDSDTVLYLLEDTFVRKITKLGQAWIPGDRFSTGLVSGHTIITPLRDPKDKDYVIVGDGGEGEVAYSSDGGISFYRTGAVPVPGRIHIAADDKFDVNKIIYAGSDSLNGKIYRWTINQSTRWEELQPSNNRFYGLVQQGGVLYSAWWDGVVNSGVDRTLYPKAIFPALAEWDSLTEGLLSGVTFTREPSSLKVSGNDDNFLWAIDNRPYNWAAKQGCLWNYIDTLARVGPWALAPAPGDLLPVDLVTGRAAETVFRWFPVSEADQYELQIAIDEGFTAMLRRELITPPDVLAPAWILPAGVTSLEAGKTYYWRVRASRAYTGEVIRSLWSATIFFGVKTGLRVRAPYAGPVLLAPANGAANIGRSPAFSWSPLPEATEYEFVLAKDAALTNMVTRLKVTATAYKYEAKLDWGTTYFWQVKATKLVPSPPSPVGSFTVMERFVPVEVAKPVAPVPPTPPWAWVLIGVLSVLLLSMLALVFLLRR